MNAQQIRNEYLKFFKERNHAVIARAKLIPQNDPTTLFTGSGMQPLLPYLLGESHSEGIRLTDSQTCLRSQDIEDVGDNRHTTFFEMLGNWSLGDYFKEQQIRWFFEFLTDVVGLDPNKIYVTAFIGDKKYGIPRDDEAANIWQKVFNEKGIEVITGAEGDAEAAKYYEVFKENPELAEFLRKLDSLRVIMQSRTTLVLDTNVAPFDLFKPGAEVLAPAKAAK